MKKGIKLKLQGDREEIKDILIKLTIRSTAPIYKELLGPFIKKEELSKIVNKLSKDLSDYLEK